MISNFINLLQDGRDHRRVWQIPPKACGGRWKERLTFATLMVIISPTTEQPFSKNMTLVVLLMRAKMCPGALFLGVVWVRSRYLQLCLWHDVFLMIHGMEVMVKESIVAFWKPSHYNRVSVTIMLIIYNSRGFLNHRATIVFLSQSCL